MTYILMAIVTHWHLNTRDSVSFQHEFKDKVQCESALEAISKNFTQVSVNVTGYCLEVKK